MRTPTTSLSLELDGCCKGKCSGVSTNGEELSPHACDNDGGLVVLRLRESDRWGHRCGRGYPPSSIDGELEILSIISSSIPSSPSASAISASSVVDPVRP